MFSGSFSYTRTTGKGGARVFAAKDRFLPELKELLEKCTIEHDDAFKVLARFDTPTTFHLSLIHISLDVAHSTAIV